MSQNENQPPVEPLEELSEEIIADIVERSIGDPEYHRLLWESRVAEQSANAYPDDQEKQAHARHKANAVKAYEEWRSSGKS